MNSFFKFFIDRNLLVNALTLMILMLGLYTAFKINLEQFPNAETNTLMIRTQYMGASPADVELEVTNKIEDALQSVSGIKTTSSTSLENSSSIRVEIDEDEDSEKVFNDIVAAVSGVNGLPDDADDPVIFQHNPKMKSILWIGFTSTTLSYLELRNYVHDFEKKTLDLPGVSQVTLSGYLDREVRIEVLPDKMEKYSISMKEILRAISDRNIRASGGSLESYVDQKNVITLSKFQNPREVGEVIVRSYENGAVVRVMDVAYIFDDFEKAQNMQRFNGKTAITLRVTKTSGADIISTADAVKALIQKEKNLLPSDTVEFIITQDDSIGVRDKFNIVKWNGIFGLILVFVILALFLNIGTSFWVAMGIPISLMGAIIFLPVFDLELDSLTMSAMVLVLGLIVDDAIVVAENIYQHRERGVSAIKAAVNGVSEVAWPVVTTIATTIIAFTPMLFIKGMIGKFIIVIPLTVILALGFSLVESLLILPSHILHSLRNGKQKISGRRWFRPVRRQFEKILYSLLQYRYMLIFLACIIIGGLVIYTSGAMRFVLMDRGRNVESLGVSLAMPLGSSLEVTSEKMLEVEKIFARFPKTELASFSSIVGSGGFRSALATHLGSFTLYLPATSERTRPMNETTQNLRKQLNQIQGVERLTLGMRKFHGPPTGNAVEIMVKGADSSTRVALVSEIMDYLGGIDGVYDLERDDKPGKDEITIKPNYPLLARYGLTAADVSQTVRTAYDGQVATSTRYGDEDVDFRVILQRTYRQNLNYLNQLKIPNNKGDLINLGEVAEFFIQPGVYAFYHEDGEPAITVTGDVDENKITSLEVMTRVEQYFDFTKMRNYPGARIDIGGEAIDTKQAMRDILFSFALAFIGIYFLLIILFNSLTQPIVVLLTVPFGIAGAIFAFILHGITQTSLFAAIGAVGLVGVVVNDALIMVSHMTVLLRENKDTKRRVLIAKGAANRLRPVILTTVTTIAGLLPLIYGFGGEDTMMGPMAMALGYGLLFASPVTLILLPCFYMVREDIVGLFSKIPYLLRRSSVSNPKIKMIEKENITQDKS